MKKTIAQGGVAAIAVATVFAVVGCAQAEGPVVEVEQLPEPVVEEVPVAAETEHVPTAAEFAGAWKLQSLAGQPVAAEFETTLEFTEDGRIGGNAGCNNYTAEYAFDEGVLSFPTAFAATKKMCPGPMMEQEDAFLKALAVFEKAAVEGDTLKLYVADSDEPLVFERIVEE